MSSLPRKDAERVPEAVRAHVRTCEQRVREFPEQSLKVLERNLYCQACSFPFNKVDTTTVKRHCQTKTKATGKATKHAQKLASWLAQSKRQQTVSVVSSLFL